MEIKGNCRANFYNSKSKLLGFHVSLISSFFPKSKIITYWRSRDHITFNASQGIKDFIVDHLSTTWILLGWSELFTCYISRSTSIITKIKLFVYRYTFKRIKHIIEIINFITIKKYSKLNRAKFFREWINQIPQQNQRSRSS